MRKVFAVFLVALLVLIGIPHVPSLSPRQVHAATSIAVITTSGTWTGAQTDGSCVKVEAIGGGGSGGASTTRGGSGGAGGNYSVVQCLPYASGTGVTVVIGNGGTSVTGSTAGIAGGDTVFGFNQVIAKGGGGGSAAGGGVPGLSTLNFPVRGSFQGGAGGPNNSNATGGAGGGGAAGPNGAGNAGAQDGTAATQTAGSGGGSASGGINNATSATTDHTTGGTGGTAFDGTLGGSGGTGLSSGNPGNPGAHGSGGGGGSGSLTTGTPNGIGGQGGLGIIWQLLSLFYGPGGGAGGGGANNAGTGCATGGTGGLYGGGGGGSGFGGCSSGAGSPGIVIITYTPGTVSMTPSAGTILPVDSFIDMQGGTIGNQLTVSDLNASTHGSIGTWSLSQSPLTHFSTVTSGLGSLRYPVAVSGTAFPGTADGQMFQDVLSTPDQFILDTLSGTLPLKISFGGYFYTNQHNGTDAGFDMISITGTSTAATTMSSVLQLQDGINIAGVNSTYGIRTHSASSGTEASRVGNNIPVLGSHTYYGTLLNDTVPGKQYVQLFDPSNGWAQMYPFSEWTASTILFVGMFVIDESKHLQSCTTAGTTSTTEPVWNDAGSTTTDGTATWTDMGTDLSGVASSISPTTPNSTGWLTMIFQMGVNTHTTFSTNFVEYDKFIISKSGTFPLMPNPLAGGSGLTLRGSGKAYWKYWLK